MFSDNISRTLILYSFSGKFPSRHGIEPLKSVCVEVIVWFGHCGGQCSL